MLVSIAVVDSCATAEKSNETLDNNMPSCEDDSSEKPLIHIINKNRKPNIFLQKVTFQTSSIALMLIIN